MQLVLEDRVVHLLQEMLEVSLHTQDW